MARLFHSPAVWVRRTLRRSGVELGVWAEGIFVLCGEGEGAG